MPPTRRALFGAAGAAVAMGLLAGCSPAPRHTSGGGAAPPPGRRALPAPVPPTGEHQAGIVTPNPAQPNLLALVTDITPGTDTARLLADLGRAITALTAGTDQRLAGLEPGDLTVTVGVGPRPVRAVEGSLPGADELPTFPRERISASDRGGDVLLQICATDPLLLSVTAAALLDHAGPRLAERWRQAGRRGPEVPVTATLSAPRNLMGFVDGIVGPNTPEQRDDDLWLGGPAPVAGGTIACLRRMEIDLGRFIALPEPAQEAVFGRHRDTGAPLSGGTIDAAPNLGAKTPDGRYLIPADAHVRRANPSAAGVGLMLRRSYSMDHPAPGLLFISFQNELRTFATTLQRMAYRDALFDYTTSTASASFLILPGYDASHPLGSTLFTSR